MPYVHHPRWARRLLKTLRVGLYALTLAAGVCAVVLTPTTVAGALSVRLTVTWGIVVGLASISALTGTLTGRYRFEFAALPWMISGLAIYAATVTELLIATPTRGAQAASMWALVIALAIRMVDLLIIARRDRAVHDAKTTQG